jgi:starvation-inducible DNA-binding protein
LMEQHEQISWMLRSFIEGEALAPDGAKLEPKKNAVGV